MIRTFSLGLAAIGLILAGLPASELRAQESATAYKVRQIPKAPMADHALLWFRLAKHSDHKWKIKAKIGLGVLVGSVKTEQTEERVPLKKPLWPTIQIAPFDVKANEFAGKGESDKRVARSMSKPFYIRQKRFVFEDENFRHYLVSVKPGDYVIGGTISTCFCWGSKRFSAQAGQVYNMGTYYVASENRLSYWPDLATLDTSTDLVGRGLVTDTMRLDNPNAEDAVPDVLSHLPFRPVSYSNAAYFGNHFGRLVNMMVPADWKPAEPLRFDGTENEAAKVTIAEEDVD